MTKPFMPAAQELSALLSANEQALLLQALSKLLEGQILRPAQLFDQMTALMHEDASWQPDLLAAEQWRVLSQSHQSNLRLVACILRYLLQPPSPALQPIDLKAFLLELSEEGQPEELLLLPMTNQLHCRVMADQVLLRALCLQFIQQYWFCFGQTCYANLSQDSKHPPQLVLHPAKVEPLRFEEWCLPLHFLRMQMQDERVPLGLVLCYASVVAGSITVQFSRLNPSQLAMRIEFPVT